MVRPETSETSSVTEHRKWAQRPDISGLAEVLHSLNVRSIPLTGIFLMLVMVALKLGSSFFIPVFLALLLKFLFASVIRGLNRFYIPTGVGAALIIVFLLGSVGTSIYQLATPARDWMVKLPHTIRVIEVKLGDVKKSIQQISQATKAVDRLTDLDGGERAQKVEVRTAKFGETLLGPTQDFLIGAGIVLILLFFLLASGDLFLRKLVGVLPRFSDKKTAVEISHRIEHDISIYLLAITVINALFGTAVGFAMYFLGLPNPFLWGVMAGLLHFIPFLGAIVGLSIVTLVALVTIDQMTTILLVPTVYFSLNLLEEYVVLPFVLGRRLMLNPVVLLLWLIFWGWLWGVPGALMAVPSLAILKIVSDH
ncbi:MAG TPA: AI-2E family transporter, partial [Candidatus Binatia bacterium]